ncbi:MAG: hypothetical protein U5N58_06395 [Actinomycetota bacterium]|nr:hypothetical protein [Actinomycetota bacterium]
MRRSFTSILVISILVALLLVVIYESRNSNPSQEPVLEEASEPVNEISAPETNPEAADENTSPETEEITETNISQEEEKDNHIDVNQLDTAETQTENGQDTEEGFPTLNLVVYEGPVVVSEGELCYFRVRAIASGDPYPAIRFSRDDSNGAWGRNIAQINLALGQSYTLAATATNDVGTETKNITLTWGSIDLKD